MSHRIIVLDEAEDELIAAQRWYENQRAGLGQEFRKAIDEAMDRLAEAPLTASPIFNPSTTIETRRMLVKQVSVFDHLCRIQRGSLGYSICSQSAAARLLARTTDTITASQAATPNRTEARGQFVEPNRVGKSPNTSLPSRTIRVAEPSDRLWFDLALPAIRQRNGAAAAHGRLRPGFLRYCAPYGARTPWLRS